MEFEGQTVHMDLESENLCVRLRLNEKSERIYLLQVYYNLGQSGSL